MEAYELILDIIRDIEVMNSKEKLIKTETSVDSLISATKQSAYCEVLLYLNDKRQEVRDND